MLAVSPISPFVVLRAPLLVLVYNYTHYSIFSTHYVNGNVWGKKRLLEQFAII